MNGIVRSVLTGTTTRSIAGTATTTGSQKIGSFAWDCQNVRCCCLFHYLSLIRCFLHSSASNGTQLFLLYRKNKKAPPINQGCFSYLTFVIYYLAADLSVPCC